MAINCSVIALWWDLAIGGRREGGRIEIPYLSISGVSELATVVENLGSSPLLGLGIESNLLWDVLELRTY